MWLSKVVMFVFPVLAIPIAVSPLAVGPESDIRYSARSLQSQEGGAKMAEATSSAWAVAGWVHCGSHVSQSEDHEDRTACLHRVSCDSVMSC